MPRKPDFTPLPNHPAFVSEPYLARYLETSRVVVDVQCPRCKEIRVRTAVEMRKEYRRPNFAGFCRPCAVDAVRSGDHVWIQRKRRGEKRLSSAGYVLIPANDIPPNDLPLYRAMQRSGQPLTEHRFEMAKFLGRPLETYELVDHKDGDKQNNKVSNLRIYLRGKQQAGSAPGYGTYYHEWQMAERRVRQLEAELEKLYAINGHSLTPTSAAFQPASGLGQVQS